MENDLMKGLVAFTLLITVSAPAKPPDRPAKVLDLSCWKLTLPVDTDRPGRPDEIAQPQLKSFVDTKYFFANNAGDGVVFRAPCGGATTKGSKYPRCELREMNRPTDTASTAGTKAAWATDDGKTHTMTMKVAITKTPSVKKHVVCAQIHDADDDVMMVRLEGSKLFVERNKTGDIMLDRKYKPGTPFDLKIQVADGHIKVWHNGDLKMNWKLSAKRCYFKAGCYTQSNPDKGDDANALGEVVIYKLNVDHRKQP